MQITPIQTNVNIIRILSGVPPVFVATVRAARVRARAPALGFAAVHMMTQNILENNLKIYVTIILDKNQHVVSIPIAITAINMARSEERKKAIKAFKIATDGYLNCGGTNRKSEVLALFKDMLGCSNIKI